MFNWFKRKEKPDYSEAQAINKRMWRFKSGRVSVPSVPRAIPVDDIPEDDAEMFFVIGLGENDG